MTGDSSARQSPDTGARRDGVRMRGAPFTLTQLSLEDLTQEVVHSPSRPPLQPAGRVEGAMTQASDVDRRTTYLLSYLLCDAAAFRFRVCWSGWMISAHPGRRKADHGESHAALPCLLYTSDAADE